MLQIILAVVGMIMAGAMGWALLEQSATQSAMASAREDNRRLDAVVDILNRNLIESPGLDHLMAPAGLNESYYHQLPAILNMPTANSNGVPFHYCPVSMINQTTNSPISAIARTVMDTGDTSYSISTISNGVAYDDSIYTSSVRALNPIAIITSAQKDSEAPPPCSEVKVVNGKIFVENGLARVITLPTSGKSAKSSIAKNLYYYTSQSGSGNQLGIDQNNTMPAELLWNILAKARPVTATIYFTENITTGNEFENYITGQASQDTALHFIGTGRLGPKISLPVNSIWTVNNTIILDNINISARNFSIESKGDLTIKNEVTFQPTLSTYSFQVSNNGRMVLSSGHIRIDSGGISVPGVIQNDGGFLQFLYSSVISVERPGTYIRTVGGGETVLINSVIGQSYLDAQIVRPFYGIEVNDPKSKIFGSYTFIIEPMNNICGFGSAFEYSYTNVENRMGVISETDYPEPSITSTQAQKTVYASERLKRDRARAQNKADELYCVGV